MDSELLKGLLVHTGLSGLYCVLFGLSVYIHLKKRTSGLWIHLTCMSALFVLSTVGYFCAASDVIDQYITSIGPAAPDASYYYQSLALDPLVILGREESPMTVAVRTCYVLSNVIADSYITYRCYIVWGRSKRIVVVPGILIIATLVCQIVPMFYYLDAGYYIGLVGGIGFTFLTNLIMTVLTASRIWWVGRQTSLALGQKMQSRYQRTIQIVLESGLLYPATLLTIVIMWACGATSSGTTTSISGVIAANLCIVNIAPTLIVIRVGLGVSSDTLATTLKTFKEDHPSDETLQYHDENGARAVAQYGSVVSPHEKV